MRTSPAGRLPAACGRGVVVVGENPEGGVDRPGIAGPLFRDPVNLCGVPWHIPDTNRITSTAVGSGTVERTGPPSRSTPWSSATSRPWHRIRLR